MLLSRPAPHSNETPPGVTTAALLFFALAAYLLLSALLIAVQVVSFTTGAWLLGGMETMGPVIYLLVAIVAALIGWGLLRLHNWARHLASVAAGVLFVLTIPTISSAVAYSHVPAIAREGLKIIACVVVFRYLNTAAVAQAFADRGRPSDTNP
jgi:hypothetical protein